MPLTDHVHPLTIAGVGIALLILVAVFVFRVTADLDALWFLATAMVIFGPILRKRD